MTVVDIERGSRRGPNARWVKPVLIGSLALNLLVLGIVGGAIFRHRGDARGPGGQGANALGYLATMPSSRRDALFSDIGEPRRKFMGLRQDLRAARQDFATVLATDAANRDHVLAAYKRVFEAESALRKAMEGFTLELLPKLTQDELKGFGRWRAVREPRGRGDNAAETPPPAAPK